MGAAQAFRCAHCGQDATIAREICPRCGGFRMMVAFTPARSLDDGPVHASELGRQRLCRVKTGIATLDRALGGGFALPSLVLLWGGEGTGKTTRTARIADHIAASLGEMAVYASSEIPATLVKRLAEREGKKLSSSWIWYQTDALAVYRETALRKPAVLVLDSAQQFEIKGEAQSDAATLATLTLARRIANTLPTLVLVISQCNANDDPSGPRKMLHLADTTIALLSDRALVKKNRFAPSPREAKL